MKIFKNFVEPFESNFVRIIVPVEKIEKINEFVKSVIGKKKEEFHHRVNGKQEFKRFYTGTLGEAAIEELLQKEFINWSIDVSTVYDKSDLINLGLNIGIKTVEYGKFPIIHKKVLRPEIISIKISDNEILVCGYASVQVLKTYQDDDLILSPYLRRKGTKTGFWGFSALEHFRNFLELKNLYESGL